MTVRPCGWTTAPRAKRRMEASSGEGVPRHHTREVVLLRIREGVPRHRVREVVLHRVREGVPQHRVREVVLLRLHEVGLLHGVLLHVRKGVLLRGVLFRGHEDLPQHHVREVHGFMSTHCYLLTRGRGRTSLRPCRFLAPVCATVPRHGRIAVQPHRFFATDTAVLPTAFAFHPLISRSLRDRGGAPVPTPIGSQRKSNQCKGEGRDRVGVRRLWC